MESGAFRCSEKAAPLSIACERSEVLTARQCRALQSHAVFWEMRRKNVMPPERPVSPVRANWLHTREPSRAQREGERVWRVKS
jgi:hypothetical protein